ncbi:uncharacterized protein LOC126369261 [Pectinophora gossypiella]|uniref:uncharacterized protein LOC126369261 n=1 Tax=Pectinophora gossypiella TaxID=13191 RepID=UPI00214E1F53|nr:uncharacterized protein LOC126369261 [Pectinophora gossypiella]
MGKTTPIHSEARKIILKVLSFFEAEKAKKQLLIPVDQVITRTCAVTGVSKKTLMRIKKEARENALSPDDDDASTSAPPEAEVPPPETSAPKKPRRNTGRKKRVALDHVGLRVLKNIVDSYYTNKNELPTLKTIWMAAKKKIHIPDGIAALRYVLDLQLGYIFVTWEDGRQVLVHKSDIPAMRQKFASFGNMQNILAPSEPLQNQLVPPERMQDQLALYECMQDTPAISGCMQINEDRTFDCVKEITEDYQRQLATIEMLRVKSKMATDPIQIKQDNDSECLNIKEEYVFEIDE